jgi:hypothetical protein
MDVKLDSHNQIQAAKVGFEVLKAASMKTAVLWAVAPLKRR